jgi:AcrR family transcriptional regulator
MTPTTAASQRPRRTQAQRRANTRAALLSAAARLLARHGYHDASLDAIAAEAGLSKGALYYTFSSKADLFLALLEERLAGRLRDLTGPSSRSDAGGTPPAAAAQRMLRGFERDPRWPPLFFEFVATCARHRLLRRHFTERFMRPGRAAITAMVQQRAAHTNLRLPIPADQVAVVVHALMNGMMLERLFDAEGAPAELVAWALTTLERGMAADAGEEGG